MTFEVDITTFFISNPIILVLFLDVAFAVMIMKRMLHPILGVFDIALIFQPLGTDDDIPPPKKNMTEDEQRSYIEKHIKGKVLTMAYRKEFPVLKEAFRIGKKDSGFTYRVNPKRVAFLQRTHRVYEYLHGLSYPINVSYGSPERLTTSKGMDMFVALKLWGQAIASTSKQNLSAPIFVVILALIAGSALGFTLFYALHQQLGFVPMPSYQAPISNSTMTSVTTATLKAGP